MEYQDQLKLQAYLDGELPEAEARKLANRLAEDPEARALLTELRQTRQALAGFENDLRLPESREFFWSKIQRQIQLLEAPAPARAAPLPWLFRLRRMLIPATGFAVVALLALVVSREGMTGGSDPSVETAVEDSGAFTYHDSSAGVTLVWLSYPADNEAAEDNDSDSLD